MPSSPELNPSQIRAVTHTRGPLMVLAGPGTGKTRVVTHKIGRLIEHEGLRPDRVLALTFSNKVDDDQAIYRFRGAYSTNCASSGSSTSGRTCR